METFEFNGEKYKKASKHQKEWGNKLISQLQLKGNETILDLGCGDGVLTKELASLVPDGKVIGIDASEGMLEAAKTYHSGNLSFVKMDINDMSFPNEFDVIFSNAALQWVKDHKKLLKNSYTALKPCGIILWNFAGDGNCSNFFEVVKGKMMDERYKNYFTGFEWPWYMPSKNEYEQLVENFKFSKVDIFEENADRFFSDTDEMIRWIDQPSLVPFMKYIPVESKEAFRNEVIKEMIKKTKQSDQSDGRCFETFRRIKVSAIK